MQYTTRHKALANRNIIGHLSYTFAWELSSIWYREYCLNLMFYPTKQTRNLIWC